MAEVSAEFTIGDAFAPITHDNMHLFSMAQFLHESRTAGRAVEMQFLIENA